MGLAALLALALLSLWRNQRFLSGYVAMARAAQAMQRGDLDGAVRSMEAAARHVPESREAGALLSFCRGLQLLRDDRSAEAVTELTRAKAVLGAGGPTDRWLLTAYAGAAFDAGNYDAFLQRQQEIARLDPTDAMAAAGVASAYACKYAATGDDRFKAEALAHLEKAAGMNKSDPEGFREYEERIRHRLETREVIDRKEYRRRFPTGRRGGP